MNDDRLMVSRGDFVIARRHASWVVAGTIALVVCAFMIGYHMGKRSALRALSSIPVASANV